MANKNFILFCLITVLFFVNQNVARAATIFVDNFESYNIGRLDGQGSWIANSFSHVENSDVFEGSKAVEVDDYYLYSPSIQKSGALVNDGTIAIYMKRIIGGTSSPEIDVKLQEGSNIIVSTKNQLYFQYLDGGSGLYNNFGPLFSSNTWFALQIQWRSSDHKVRYNINGGLWTDWAPGVANWSAGLDTVNIRVTNGVAYIDNIEENIATNRNPVLIVPGIGSTEIEKGGDLLWVDVNRIVGDPTDSFLDPLAFNHDNTPSDSTLYITDVIRKKTFWPVTFDYTDGLINELENQGYVEEQNLFTFPYDWRYGLSGKYADGTTNSDLLKNKIQEILAQTSASKVDVVAHSMGGLIVKKYVQDNPTSNYIGKAVFVGVPETGAPEAVKALIQGDNFGIGLGPFGLSDSEMKKLAQNMPGVYDLLPSPQYYNQAGSFVSQIDIGYGIGDPTEKDLNYQDFKNYLTQENNLNSLALSGAENLHTNNFDNYDIRAGGVDLYSLDGCKTATPTNFLEVKYKDILGNYHTGYDKVDLKVGDGTVPIQSSTNLPIDQSKKYYALTGQHSKLLSQDGTRQEIVNLISGSNLSVDPKIVTQNSNSCQLNGKAIIVYSPVDVSVTDQLGNKIGLVNGNVVNSIPNANFEILGGHKFIYLPTDAGQTYTTALQGTGSGTFTLKTENIQNNQITGSENFINIPVTTSLTGTMDLPITSGSPTTLIIKPAPGSQLQTILPMVITSGQAQDFIPPISTATLSGMLSKTGLYRSNVGVAIKSVDSNSGILYLGYNLDGQGYRSINGDTANFSLTDNGSHAISYFATDRAGNNELEKVINFGIQKLPTLKDQCKNNGWKNFGSMFKNQGDCVSFVETGK